MSSIFLSYVPLLNRLVGSPDDSAKLIRLSPVEVHDFETGPEKRSRTLKHLLKANHANHAVLYHDLHYHNHMPHILCSAYLLGADPTQLQNIYDVESQELEGWKDSPEEVTRDDWRHFLGDGQFQRAFLDFFEDALALRHSYDWKEVVNEFMFQGKEPLVNGLISGLGHPLIHLGYAYEMNSREIAMEALTMAATQYDFLHKYLDDPAYTKPSRTKSASPRELLEKIAADKRFDGVFSEPNLGNIGPLFEKHEDLVMEYWNAWEIGSDPLKAFRESQEVAVELLVATVQPGTYSYNFFMVHLLTTSHAVRILLPVIPARFHISLVRQWWLFVVAVYVCELRPKMDPDNIPADVIKGRGWKDVEKRALKSEWATDAHYVKALRAMKEAARTWGDIHDRYLASALRFVDDFHGWSF